MLEWEKRCQINDLNHPNSGWVQASFMLGKGGAGREQRGLRLGGDRQLQTPGRQGLGRAVKLLHPWLVDCHWHRSVHDVFINVWLETLFLCVCVHIPLSPQERQTSGKGLFVEISSCKQDSYWWSTSLHVGLQGWVEAPVFFCFGPKVKAAKGGIYSVEAERQSIFYLLECQFCN